MVVEGGPNTQMMAAAVHTLVIEQVDSIELALAILW